MNWMRNITYDSTDLKNGSNIVFQIYDCTLIIFMDWIGLTQDRDSVADACECGNEPSGSVKRGEFLE